MTPQTSNNDPTVRLSQVIEDLIKVCDQGDLTLGDFLRELSVYGHMLVCLACAAPFLLPVPLPGLSTVFGFVICVASLQIAFNKDPWVPPSWRSRKISAGMVKKIFTSLLRVTRYTEKAIKPRLRFFARHPGAVRFNGVVIFCISLLLSLPMPPGFNAPPALAIVLLALGSLERDGLAVMAGYALSLLNVVLFGGFFVLGYEGLQALLH
jgi:hypothetical protein